MEKEDAFKRIQRYLGRSDTHPRLVNANNPVDLDEVRQQFAVGDNIFKSAADFSTADEDLSEDSLFSYLGSASGNVFLTGFTSYYKLLGEQKLRDFLNRISGISCARMSSFCATSAKQLSLLLIRDMDSMSICSPAIKQTFRSLSLYRLRFVSRGSRHRSAACRI